MVELIAEVEIAAPPERVWAVLSDFAAYGEWHPYQTIEGEAKKHGLIKVTSRNLKTQVQESVSAAFILRLKPNAVLEYFSGRPFFWTGKRWFHLEATDKGTLVRHGQKFAGILADRAFKTTHKIERLRPHLEAVSRALSRRVVAPQTPRPPAGNRRSRRASEAKKRGAD